MRLARRILVAGGALLLNGLVSSCTGPDSRLIPEAPPPRRTPSMPAPRPAQTPPAQRIVPAPMIPSGTGQPAPNPAAMRWQDRPFTAGAWHWSGGAAGSMARFSGPAGTLVLLACQKSASGNAVAFIRLGGGSSPQAGAATMATTLTLLADSQSRTLPATLSSTAGTVSAQLAARDSLLDAVAFSRGKFGLEVPGFAPLQLPTWAEVARVIEDCR